MPKNDSVKTAIRVFSLVQYMLNNQGTNPENGISTTEILKELYGLKAKKGTKEKKLMDIYKNQYESAYDKFKLDVEIIDTLFPLPGKSSFVNLEKARNKPRRWRYSGTWAFLELKERKDALALLIGLQLAGSFLYHSDESIERLTNRVMAALPEDVRNDAKALMDGMNLEQNILGLTGDARDSDVPDRWLRDLLEATRAEGKNRFLQISIEDPHPGLSFRGLFLPKKVYFANHDWYVIGLIMEDGFDFAAVDRAKKAKVRLVRLSRIKNMEKYPAERLVPMAANFDLSEKQMEKVMRAVYQGMFNFTMSEVLSDEFPPTAEVQLKFFGPFVDSAKRARLLYGEKGKSDLPPEKIDGVTCKNVLEYVADVSCVDENGEPDIVHGFPLKMTVFKAPDQVVVCGPRKLQEDAIAIAEGFIRRTKEEMAHQDKAAKSRKKTKK